MRTLLLISFCFWIVAVVGQTFTSHSPSLPPQLLYISLVAVAVPTSVVAYKGAVFAGQLRHALHGMVSPLS
jgi:uncharacterized membrane protein